MVLHLHPHPRVESLERLAVALNSLELAAEVKRHLCVRENRSVNARWVPQGVEYVRAEKPIESYAIRGAAGVAGIAEFLQVAIGAGRE